MTKSMTVVPSTGSSVLSAVNSFSVVGCSTKSVGRSRECTTEWSQPGVEQHGNRLLVHHRLRVDGRRASVVPRLVGGRTRRLRAVGLLRVGQLRAQ